MKLANITNKLVSVGIIALLGSGYLAFRMGLHLAGLGRRTTLIAVFAVAALLLLLDRSLRFRRD